MPEDLLDAAGASSASHRLTIDHDETDRRAGAPRPPTPRSTSPAPSRSPRPATFSVSGTAELSALVPDDVLDRLLGTTVPGINAAYSSGRLPGDVEDRTSATLDGNLATVWSPGIGPQAGSWLEYDLARPITLRPPVDGDRHRRSALGAHLDHRAAPAARAAPWRSPRWPTSAQPWATQNVTVGFPALTGTDVRVTFDTVRPVTDLDYYSDAQVALPIGIAEMDIPGMPRAVPGPAQLPAPCRSDLLTVDGAPVPVTHHRHHRDGRRRSGPCRCRGCGSAANGITLGAGPHEVRTQPGFPPGVDVDINSVVLDSAPGGAALPTATSGRVEPAESGPAPTADASCSSSTTSAKVVVHAPDGTVLDGAGAEHQRGMARHHRHRHGPGCPPGSSTATPTGGWSRRRSRDATWSSPWTGRRSDWCGSRSWCRRVTLGLCLVLACWPRRRRQRRNGATVTVPATPTGKDTETSPISEVGARSTGQSLVGLAPAVDGTRPRWFVVLAVSVVTGGVTSAIISPRAGHSCRRSPTFLALVVGYGRVFLALGSVGLLVAVDRMVTSGQSTFRYLAEFGWPTHFETAEHPGLVRRRRARCRRARARGARSPGAARAVAR